MGGTTRHEQQFTQSHRYEVASLGSVLLRISSYTFSCQLKGGDHIMSDPRCHTALGSTVKLHKS